MRLLLLSIVLLSVTCIQANANAEGYGLVATVREIGSVHFEQTLIGFAPDYFDYGQMIDPFATVHIAPPSGLYLDFRPLDSTERIFNLNVWWSDNPNRQYQLSLNFLYGDTENFSWGFPLSSPKVSLTESGRTTEYSVPLNNNQFTCYGSGPSQLAIDFGFSQVPEPSALVVLGLSLFGLVFRKYTLR